MINRIITYLLLFLVGIEFSLGSHAPVKAQFGDFEVTSEVEVSLSIPYRVMLRDEKPMVIVGIKNNSSQPLTLVEDLGWFSTNVHGFNQLFFEVERKSGSYVADGEMGYKPWRATAELEPFLRKKLEPKNSLVASTPEINLVGDWRYTDASKVRCILLVGENQVATSNWVPIQFLEQSVGDHVSSEQIDYGAKSGNLAKMFVCDIQGKQWIFHDNRRVAMVPEGSTPSYEPNAETGVITINFKGSKAEPVTHSIRKAQTLSGPRELVPHLYAIEGLEAQPESGNAHHDSNKGQINQPVEIKITSAGKSSSAWLWFFGGVILIVICVLLFRSSR